MAWIVLEKRAEPSLAMTFLSPLVAIALTLASSAAIFAAVSAVPRNSCSCFADSASKTRTVPSLDPTATCFVSAEVLTQVIVPDLNSCTCFC